MRLPGFRAVGLTMALRGRAAGGRCDRQGRQHQPREREWAAQGPGWQTGF